jgi:hypothetical protein
MAAQPLSRWGQPAPAPYPNEVWPADSESDEDTSLPSPERLAWRWGRLQTLAEEPDSERAALVADLLTVLLPLVASVALGGLVLGVALRWAS